MLKQLRIKTPLFLILFILFMSSSNLFSQTNHGQAPSATIVISSKVMVETQPSESNEKLSMITVKILAMVLDVITGETFEVEFSESANGESVAIRTGIVGRKFKSFQQVVHEMLEEERKRKEKGKLGPRNGGDIILILKPGSEKDPYPIEEDTDATTFVYKGLEEFNDKVLGDLCKFLDEMTIEK